jgi:hypothetical protein
MGGLCSGGAAAAQGGEGGGGGGGNADRALGGDELRGSAAIARGSEAREGRESMRSADGVWLAEAARGSLEASRARAADSRSGGMCAPVADVPRATLLDADAAARKQLRSSSDHVHDVLASFGVLAVAEGAVRGASACDETAAPVAPSASSPPKPSSPAPAGGAAASEPSAPPLAAAAAAPEAEATALTQAQPLAQPLPQPPAQAWTAEDNESAISAAAGEELFRKLRRRRGSANRSAYDSESDPFEGLSTDSEEALNQVAELPSAAGGGGGGGGRRDSVRGAETLARFAAAEAEEEARRAAGGADAEDGKEGDGEEKDVEMTAAAASRLQAMVQSGEYTYLASKMSEIAQVKMQTLSVMGKLNLVYNPSLVRAIVEILRAKELQIDRARAAQQLDAEAHSQLAASIAEVRTIIARKTNTNTVSSARRLLRRTHSSHSVLATAASTMSLAAAPLATSISSSPASPASSSSPSAPSASAARVAAPRLPLAFHVHHAKTGSAVAPPAAWACPRRASLVPASPPVVRKRSTPAAGAAAAAAAAADMATAAASAAPPDIHNLVSVCVSEAIDMLLVTVKDDMARAATEARQPALAQYVTSCWARLKKAQRLEEGDADEARWSAALAEEASLLDAVSRAVSLYHPEASRFRAARRAAKECVLAVELMGIQAATHARLRDPLLAATPPPRDHKAAAGSD